jgi:enolase-phosphatase E1
MSVHAVVLDIEGTTGSLSHVRDVLFPYARKRIGAWMRERRGTEDWHRVVRSVRAHTAEPGLDEEAVVARLEHWADADIKAAPLKDLQGMIWASGYAAGELYGHVYPEVPSALERWKAQGIARYIYSSGSEAAQRDWFRHTEAGDLSGLLDGYFDLVSAGPKGEAGSYRAVSGLLDGPGSSTLFVSDTGEELDAAAAAGWQTVAVRRPEDTRGTAVPGHPVVSCLDALGLVPLTDGVDR